MARNDTTSAIIDGILRFAVVGGALSAVVIAPNMAQALDKPMRKIFQALDTRAQERAVHHAMLYMKRRGLLAEDYQHGLRITTAGKWRLKEADFENLAIPVPGQWDKRWRLVFFDIPQTNNPARRLLTAKLQSLGFQMLQQSIWIYPYACRHEVEMICEMYKVSRYVTYVEVSHIDRSDGLKRRFSSILKPGE